MPVLNRENYQALASGHIHTPVSEKLRKVLEYLGNESRFPGDIVSVHPDAYPLFDVAQSGHLVFLLETLSERRDIRREKDNRLVHPSWMVTVTGWERLSPPAPGGTPGTVFVAMAQQVDMNAAYDEGIEPAVIDDCGLTITQAGRIQHNDSINDLIMAGIRAAQVVIADVTHQRNGVYFEAGFAMGLGRVVVWMCRHDDLVNVHFDTRQYNHIAWDDPADLRRKLSARLRATVDVPARAGV